MGRFSIGARVRDPDGDEGVIVGKPSKGYRTVEYDSVTLDGLRMNWDKKRLTPIEAAPVATAPAAQEQVELTLTVGATGKTRDGRIVGPLVKQENGNWPFRVQGSVGINDEWRANGQWQLGSTIHDNDIVEILPASTTDWQPKVGDRVRFLEPYSIAKTGDEGVITGFWSADGNPKGGVGVLVNGRTVSCYISRVEPATSPVMAETLWAPVVGKYGKTRDGRKVGPILNFADGLFHVPSDSTGGNHLWHPDGKAVLVDNCNDLVAEWVDEAPVVAVEAAQPAANDPTTPERKFKVGDRVNWTRVRGEFDGSTIEAHEGLVFDWKLRATSGNYTYAFHSELELVTARAPTPTESFIVARLTAKGEPRPNVRPRVHATLADAEAEAQRLADRLGDEFAVYQRVATRTVDAGPVPTRPVENFKRALREPLYLSSAFLWESTTQGWDFWSSQFHSGQLTHLGRAILKKWIAEAEAANDNTAKAAA